MPAVPQPLARQPRLRRRRHALRHRRRRRELQLRRLRPGRQPAQPVRRPARRRRRHDDAADRARAARCARRTCARPATRPRSTARSCASTPTPAPRWPTTRSPARRRQRAPDRRVRPAQPVPHTFRPGTNEVWAGDVGWNDLGGDQPRHRPRRPASATSAGPATRAPAAWAPTTTPTSTSASRSTRGRRRARHAVLHLQPRRTVVAGDGCPNGGSSITGLAFYDGGNFPAAYEGALFFADYSRHCIWVMFTGANGLPDPSTRQAFVTGGPGRSTSRSARAATCSTSTSTAARSTASTPPRATRRRPPRHATPASGAAPLTVDFDGRPRPTPNGDTLSYAWDLDDDGAFDDSTSATASFTYTAPGDHTVRLRVSDPSGLSDTTTVMVHVGTPPTATIDTPVAGTTWRVGQTDRVLGQRPRLAGQPAAGREPHLGAEPAALRERRELPHPSGAELPGRRLRIVQRARPRVPLLSRAPAQGDRRQRPLDHRDAPARPAHRRLTVDSDPPGLQLSLGSQTARRALHP